MDAMEKAKLAIVKAEKYEFYPAFDSGLMLLHDELDDEPELREGAVGQLLKNKDQIEQVRLILEGRARVLRAQELIGQPCWEYVDGEGTRAGTVDSVDQGNGKVYISVPVGSHGGQTRVMADTAKLFILAKQVTKKEIAAAGSDTTQTADPATSDQPKVEKTSTRKKLLDILGGTLTGAKEK